jgi:hypothetical protein
MRDLAIIQAGEAAAKIKRNPEYDVSVLSTTAAWLAYLARMLDDKYQEERMSPAAWRVTKAMLLEGHA